jgi:hypothetical protein
MEQISNGRRRVFLKLAGKTLLLSAVALGLAGAFTASAQQYHFNPEHRRPIDATLQDLREVREHNPPRGDDNRRRYENAFRNLSQFKERLREGGVFDKGKLDEAIQNVHSVVDHCPMGDRGRDILSRDLEHLRDLREHFDRDGWRFDPDRRDDH